MNNFLVNVKLAYWKMIDNVYDLYGSVFSRIKYMFSFMFSYHIDHNMIVLLFLSILLVILLWYLLLRKVQEKAITIPTLPSFQNMVMKPDKPRFRKRDKIRYYATRLNRKFQDLTNRLQTIKSKDQKQRIMSLFAKKILHEKGPKLLKRELPDALLVPDYEEENKSLPEEFQLIMDFFKNFGYMEKNFLSDFSKHVETLKLEKDDYLFRIGDPDNNVFVVKSGKIKVFIEENDFSMTIREVERGGSINSLLSILDVIVGNTQPYKTVQAVAECSSEVLRFKANVFNTMFIDSPETMVRVVQLFALRLQRVTFLSLHHYLGLTSELINKNSLALSDCQVINLANKYPHLKDNSLFRQLSVDIEIASNGNVEKKPINIEFNIDKKDINFSGLSSEKDISIKVEPDLELGEVKNPGSVKELNHLNIPSNTKNMKTRHRKGSFTSTVKQIGENAELKEQAMECLKAAKSDIVQILGLKDESVLSKLKLTIVPANTTLVREGEEETNVYFVIIGELIALQHYVGNETSKLSPLFTTKPGELCGVEAIITTDASFYAIRANIPTQVVVLYRDLLYSLIKNNPNILLKLSNLLVRRMSPFLRQIDFALEWNSVKAGFPLYEVNDVPKNVYIVLNGRFRQIHIRPDGSREIVTELGRGELMGFVEVLCDQQRATTLMAIRDSEVALIPSGLLKWIKYKAPQVVSRLIQLFADRLFVTMSRNHLQQGVLDNTPRGIMGNLRTVAVIPSTPEVPVEPFVLELQHSMRHIGATVRLTSEIIIKRLGSKALDAVNEYRLLSWLNQQEDDHRLVFYVADRSGNSVWTQRCIRQADCVLVVALAKRDPKLTEIEKSIESASTKVSKILVLIYPPDALFPPIGKTSEWLNARPWISRHYHIRCPKRLFTKKRHNRLVELYKRVFSLENPSPHSDMSRLARIISGTSIGLVLGGGGARGCSHVGVIRAFHEAGIPIDMIGGTSIGSFMGALWAEETRLTQYTQRARAYCKEMTNVWKMLLDLTYSPVSIFSGKGMNMALEKVFQDRQIEDLWIPYFAITTDITNSKMRVHTNGSLWRFVRASMSLSGYLPPLCHPDDGSLLLDGGYTNNLPADVMNEMGAEQIFAVDVGSNDDTDLSNYGDWLSRGKLMYHRYFTTSPLKVLNLTEIQSRLAYVSCVRQLEELKAMNICEYMRPPIETYGTLQFGSFDEIMEVGYKYTKEKLLQWQTENSLKHFARGQLQWLNKMKTTIPPTPSFIKKGKPHSSNEMTNLDIKKNIIDLTEMVSKIGPNKDKSYYDSESDSEDEFWTKIKMEDDEESAVEILLRSKNLHGQRLSSEQLKSNDNLEHVSKELSQSNSANWQSKNEHSIMSGDNRKKKIISEEVVIKRKSSTNFSNRHDVVEEEKELEELEEAVEESHYDDYDHDDEGGDDDDDYDSQQNHRNTPGSDIYEQFDVREPKSQDRKDESLALGGRRLSGLFQSSMEKYDDGYDEDLEDGDQYVEAASDPESFNRALQNTTHKRKHRRRSLNRLHKSRSYEPGNLESP